MKNIFKKGICAFLAVIIVLNMGISTFGTEHVSVYEGKVISVMGDSISTFAGYIPEADGFNLEHKTYYPKGVITDVNQLWWMKVIKELDAKLGINESWTGSRINNVMDGNTGNRGEKAAMASLTRIKNLGSNGTPDIILFYGGTNDIGKETLGNFNPVEAPTETDLESVKWSTEAEAYTAAIMRMQYFYPDAEIIMLLPTYTESYYSDENLDKFNETYKAICEHYGVEYVDLRNYLTRQDLYDGIHPYEKGMEKIKNEVIKILAEKENIRPGENKVYSITHNLKNAKAEKHYYKGFSAGRIFEETVSGENLSVTVTMGGKDITAEVYKDGRIRIDSVDGDIAVTATGNFDADGHLQKLPENVCAETNIWELLEPENIYYTVNGWGHEPVLPNVHSVTFPVNESERIWASCFGTVTEDGYTSTGSRITWFSEEGTLRSMSKSEVVSEYNSKGYLTAPEGAVAVNIPMLSADEKWEIYLLDRSHSFGEWETVTAPTAENPGEEKRVCSACETVETREIPAFGYTLADINLDGSVNVFDAYYARLVAAKLIQPTEKQLQYGDVDGDGKITAIDANIIRKFVAKIITELPLAQ